MTKEYILNYFKDINFMYNNSSMFDTLKRMLDELTEPCESYRSGWHDAIGKALKECYDIRCEEGHFRVIQEETLVGVGMSMEYVEPCEDAVSRESAIKALKVAYWDKDIQSAKDDPCIVDAMTDWSIRQIKDLPSIQPERPKGEWIESEFDESVYCSECNAEFESKYRFCPNCGADMRTKEVQDV